MPSDFFIKRLDERGYFTYSGCKIIGIVAGAKGTLYVRHRKTQKKYCTSCGIVYHKKSVCPRCGQGRIDL